ncbi:hypothetical protein [Chryseobacterium populi]|uniref:hypothetical protein n=1 Tax=Chryseobacterium populi TaxID=1144316 RepID=UPI001EE66F7B|nr:hypothetical protein [Chryseobacterium populi]
MTSDFTIMSVSQNFLNLQTGIDFITIQRIVHAKHLYSGETEEIVEKLALSKVSITSSVE